MCRALITMGTAEDLRLKKARKLSGSQHQRILLPREKLSRTKKRQKR